MSDKKTIKTSIGGQALTEGIMMKGPKKTAMAVRRPDGTIYLETEDNKSAFKKIKKIPIVRGVFAFAESMISGYKYLMKSVEISMPDEFASEKPAASEKGSPEKEECSENITETEAHENTDVTTDAPSADEAAIKSDKKASQGKEKKEEKPLSGAEMTFAMIIGVVLGLALAIFLFKFLPELVFGGLAVLFPGIKGEGYGFSLLRAAVTGVMKIIILVAYMAAVSCLKEIRRTFMYHGAEHKTIFCYENGLELTTENVRLQKRFHPRCGTSFLVLSVLVSIFFGMFIPSTVVAGNEFLNVLARTGLGLLLLPVIMGVGYELIRIAGRHDNALTRIISAPGTWLQHITTKEPDDSMIECAILAVKEVIPDDGSDIL
ncbi:MAG: DUF1385 domain-containing protein [Clostridia bacterium]|nr:DUF1385 domain-containing protein [Clostridia bacterium]